jgi:ribose transport system substrate-binding protein
LLRCNFKAYHRASARKEHDRDKTGAQRDVSRIALLTQSPSDTNSQISTAATAAASNPATIVIAPAEFAALGKPIDEAAKKIKIMGRGAAADTEAMMSLLATDNLNADRIARGCSHCSDHEVIG